jgi:hypothetical protein
LHNEEVGGRGGRKEKEKCIEAVVYEGGRRKGVQVAAMMYVL